MNHHLKAVTQRCPVVTVRRMLPVDQTLTIPHQTLRTVTTLIPSLQKVKVRDQLFKIVFSNLVYMGYSREYLRELIEISRHIYFK